MVEGARLESVYVERHRGFESLSHRQFLSQTLLRVRERFLLTTSELFRPASAQQAPLFRLIPALLHSGRPLEGKVACGRYRL